LYIYINSITFYLIKTPPSNLRIQKVHDLCEKVWGKRTPTVLDAFAGGGSIPFNANPLREETFL
jgi:adenine-specific DNA methylase